MGSLGRDEIPGKTEGWKDPSLTQRVITEDCTSEASNTIAISTG